MTQVVNYRSPNGSRFPVKWSSAKTSKDRWYWDQVHNPTPLTPLAQDLIAIKRQGMYKGGEITGRPFHEERIYANGYGFSRTVKATHGEAKLALTRATNDSRKRIDHLVELWESSYKPETEALSLSIRNWASSADSLDELISGYSHLESAWRRCGELHTIATGLAAVAMRQFETFCRDRFGDEGTRVAVESVSGMPNMSVESGKALWELSRRVLEKPSVACLLRTETGSGFLNQLESVRDGREFHSEFDEFLTKWGQRNESYYEIEYETWIEDPEFVLVTLRRFIETPECQSPAALHDRAKRVRVARTEIVRNILNGSGDLKKFLSMQSRAQQHTILMEDHNYFIDQRAYTSLRIPHQAIGTLMVEAGALDHKNDVFFLHSDEIKAHTDSPSQTYQSLIKKRRSERMSWMHVLPPPYIGGDAPLANVTTPNETRTIRRTLTGSPASAGSAHGTARVILSLDDAHRLDAGDVLVTYASAPPWTPLFSIASAVVTDVGGPLAHCAIVAREYGIPAVVGVNSATTEIQDGDMISVDGTSGVVTIQRN